MTGDTKKDLKLNLKLKDRIASTVPNTPGIPTFRSDKASNSNDDQLTKLSRIKSLGRLDLRSSIISHNPTPDDPHNSDTGSLYTSRTHNTITSKLINMLPHAMRSYYNDFTTIDWVTAFLKTNRFQYELHHKHWITNISHKNTDQIDEKLEVKMPLYYRLYLTLGRWVLIVLIGFVFSLVAYGIDKIEILLVGFKHGYCSSNWFISQVSCCAAFEALPPKNPMMYRNVFKSGYVSKINESGCPDWISWEIYFEKFYQSHYIRFDFILYVILTIFLAVLACIITLTTKISSGYSIPTTTHSLHTDEEDNEDEEDDYEEPQFGIDSTLLKTTFVEGRTMYTAAGSGVPEVKTILSGFVIRRFLGTYTFFAKTIALIFAIASGMSLGKEGPYVHLAATVGNILSRLFPFVSRNELLSKQILSAAASSGVALAFGSPLGGVLFILEEINHSLPSYQLFQIFFCAIISTLFLKFLDPYGTGNSVLFELKYDSDWKPIELIFFIFIGLAGGVFGALYVKFTGWWPKFFRQLPLIKGRPKFEVMLIALITGVVTFWNPYTKQASAELILDLATPCNGNELYRSLCPNSDKQYIEALSSILFALIVKVVLTSITFGIKVPYGIYVPSMVIGALFGRLFATFIEFLNHATNTTVILGLCPEGKDCVDLGIYAMISAGAFMAGVTRMNITLVVILFEITSSYTYVLPISISIAVANWMGNYIESNSLYESLLVANDYPFMAPETEPIDPFKTAGEIIEDSVKYTKPSSRSNVPGLGSVPGQQFSRNASFLSPQPKTAQLVDNNLSDKLFLDITDSPYVSVQILKSKLTLLTSKAMLDGCIAFVRNNVCVGLLFFSELEFCLDKINEFCLEYVITEDLYCKVHDENVYINDSISMESIRNGMKYNSSVIKNNIRDTEVDYFNYGSTGTDDANKQLILDLQNEMERMSDLTSEITYNPIFLNYNSELSLAHLVFDKIGNRVIVLIKDGGYYGLLHKKTLIDYLRRER